jgi:hypothetical protein
MPEGAVSAAQAVARPVQAAQLKYATEIRNIAKCPMHLNFSQIEVAYRFALADVESVKNFLPVARLQPERTLPGNKPIKDCCAGWSLSMYTTLEALQSKARKTIKTAPKFLKRVGDHYSQVKLTESCGLHTGPNSEGHFEFFERTTFDGRQALVSHGPLGL